MTTTTSTTTTRRFRLGVWNPAGAQLLEFSSEEAREAARLRYQRDGFITWSQI